MSLLHAEAAIPKVANTGVANTEVDALKSEIDALKESLSCVSEASVRISGNLDAGAALQELVDSVRSLTNARYGALQIFEPSGEIREFYTSGETDEDRERAIHPLHGLGLLNHLQNAVGPVRLKDIPASLESAVDPENAQSVKTFLGMPLHCRVEHVGNIYLADKNGGREFSEYDENVAKLFGAQAASIIASVKKYQEALQARADMETLMEISPVAVSVFDVRMGALTYANQEARRIMGFANSSDEAMENVFLTSRFTRPDGKEVSFAELPGTRALQSGETIIADEIVTHLADGTTFTLLVSCAPIFSDTGEMISLLTVSQDLTPLEDLELQRIEFLGMVSEELRTPLISIKGSAAALKGNLDPAAPSETLQLVSIIDQQADLMRGQLNNLIELTQIETGKLAVAVEPTDVSSLIEQSCDEYLQNHAAMNIKLDVEEGLAHVLADRQRIGEVLNNFLRHAAMHSSESSPVTVSAATSDIHVSISVSAAGEPAPPESLSLPVNAEEHSQLFGSMALAVHKAADLLSRGEGLPMAFCRGVVEAHGGRINTEVDSQEGTLKLTFTLPTVDEHDDVSTPGAPVSAGSTASALAGKTQIIVAIEDPRLSRMVRHVLNDAGYGTVPNADLEELAELGASEKAQLIILDIAGREEESFRALRDVGNPVNVPAIVLCDRDDEEYVVRAFDMGADGYMVKPFSPSEMIARIRATLRRVSEANQRQASRSYQSGAVRINFDERVVTVSGKPVQLTPTEYKLITELANSAGRVLTQDALLHRVWGAEYSGEPQLLRAYVKSLRQKLGDKARQPSYIFTEHGVGYRMARPDSPFRGV